MRHFNKISIEMTAFTLRQNLLHMQHHFLCNISYVAIAMSMGKSLKYTTSNYGVAEQQLSHGKGCIAICAHIPQLTLVFVKENQSSD